MKNRCEENPCCGDPNSCTLNTRAVAPADGLETVEYHYFNSTQGTWLPCAFPEMARTEGKQTRELVTRSQAEAIIAVERADHEATRELLNASVDDYNKALSDNAALTARVNGFEGFLDDLAEILGCERDIGDVVNELDTINNRAEALETQLAAAKANIESLVYVYEVNLNNHNDGEDYDIYVEACRFINRKPQL